MLMRRMRIRPWLSEDLEGSSPALDSPGKLSFSVKVLGFEVVLVLPRGSLVLSLLDFAGQLKNPANGRNKETTLLKDTSLWADGQKERQGWMRPMMKWTEISAGW